MSINPGDVLTYKGERVQVLAVDSDPRANVWAFRLSDPDVSIFPSPADLSA